jgi:hypothetical protein
VALALLVASPVLAGDPPIAAPGQEVPAHAAGGWPTDLTGDDQKPTRTVEQQANLEAVSKELKRLANTNGPDSVVLQSKMLIRSMSAGAVGPTEVRVAGPSTEAGPDHLEIDVETGLYFDEKTTTAESRRDTVWKEVATPVLDEMVSFHIAPESLELVFLYDVQPATHGEQLTFDVSAPASHESFRVRLARPVLEAIVANQVANEAMAEKAVFTPVVVVPKPQP